MKIAWYGQSCFRLIIKTNGAEKTTLFIDPFDKEIGLTPPRGNADIVICSHSHHDHNNVNSLSGAPFVVDGPGEYDIKKVYIKGVYSFHDDKKGKERGINTISIIEAEDLKICHLGDLGQKELSDTQLEKIGEMKEVINLKRIIEYAASYPVSTQRRLGYLLDLCEIKSDSLHEQVKIIAGYAKLTKDSNQFNAKWRIYYD